MDIDQDVLNILSSRPFGLSEVYRKHTYKVMRKGQEVEVEILDAGTECNHGRYQCRATLGGRTAYGNSNDNLQTALSLVQWQKLD